MQRRTLLKLGAGAGLALALAGTGLALLRPGWRDGHLTPHGRALFAAVGRAVLDGLLPPDPAAAQAALVAHVDRVDATIAGFPPALQAELAQLTTVLCTAPGRLALVGLATDWPQVDTTELQAALQSLRTSSLAVRQQVFHALRDLSNAAWFADAQTWASVGYPGPRPV
jgi:hypothetical protein